MKKSEFEALLTRRFKNFILGYEGTQKEYALNDDAFDNFNRLAIKLDLPREKVLQVYFEKHLDGIVSHIRGNTSQRESVHERIKDAVMYLMLLDGMIYENEQAERQHD